MKPVPWADGSTPDSGLNWRGRPITGATPIPVLWDEWYIPKFSHWARGGRPTPEGLWELQIGSILWAKKPEALLRMLVNRQYALWWTWEEVGTIRDEVEPPLSIRPEYSHTVWTDRVFRILQKVSPMEKEIIKDILQQRLFAPAWGPYTNAPCLVPKTNGKYHFIISAVSANQHTLEDAAKPPNVKEFSEAFARPPMSSQIHFHCGFDQKMLHEDSRDYMAFQTTHSMYLQTRTVQGATNSVSAFVKVYYKILNTHLGSIAEILVGNVRVKGP